MNLELTLKEERSEVQSVLSPGLTSQYVVGERDWTRGGQGREPGEEGPCKV